MKILLFIIYYFSQKLTCIGWAKKLEKEVKAHEKNNTETFDPFVTLV